MKIGSTCVIIDTMRLRAWLSGFGRTENGKRKLVMVTKHISLSKSEEVADFGENKDAKAESSIGRNDEIEEKMLRRRQLRCQGWWLRVR